MARIPGKPPFAKDVFGSGRAVLGQLRPFGLDSSHLAVILLAGQ